MSSFQLSNLSRLRQGRKLKDIIYSLAFSVPSSIGLNDLQYL
jgi:hypothetical protein